MPPPSGRMTLCGFRHAAQEALRVPARQFADHPRLSSGWNPAKASLDSKLPSDSGRGSRLQRICNNSARLLGERAGTAHILPSGRDWGMHPQGDTSRARRQMPLRHDEARAIDRHGHQVQTGFHREDETTRLEHTHPPIGAPCAFRKDDERQAFADQRPPASENAGAVWIAPVDQQVAGPPEVPSEERKSPRAIPSR